MSIKERLTKVVCEAIRKSRENGNRMGPLVDYLLAKGVTIPEWIPVTERLPEELPKDVVHGLNEFVRLWMFWLREKDSIGYVPLGTLTHTKTGRMLKKNIALLGSPTGCHCQNRQRRCSDEKTDRQIAGRYSLCGI